MINEIFRLQRHFNGSYLNSCGELIISDRGNVYFIASDCENKEDVICKLLEWCSRPIAKGQPYTTNERNIKWRNSLLCGYNNYLGTNFTQEDMYWIYDKLGNAINHELTLKFIHSGFDLSLVRPQESDIEKCKEWPYKPCINYEDGCEEWAGCPCVHYKDKSED